LSETKMPERRDLKGGADTPAQKSNEPTSIPRDTPAEKAPKIPIPQSPDIPSVRTFKDDVSKLVRGSKISLVRAATLEQEKRRGQEPASPTFSGPSRKRILTALAVVLVLVTVGALALFVVSVVQSQRSGGGGAAVTQSPALIFTEQTLPLTIQAGARARDVLSLLKQARETSSLTLGAITRIIPVGISTNPDTAELMQSTMTTQEFFASLQTHATESLSRTFSPEFFLGIHTIEQNVPVFVVPIISYERAFAGMLAWEKDMNADLSPFFTPVPYERQGADGSITLSQFEDAVIRNFDVRVLRDAQDTITMLYAFPTRDILIIAESPHSFVEVLSRLRAERRL